MKKFTNNLYSKTYSTATNLDRSQTLVVDNVQYRLAKNKKSMIKLDKNGKQVSNGQSNLINKVSSVNYKNGIHKLTNHQTYIAKKSFKRSTKFKLIFKNRSRFKFIKSTKFNSFNVSKNRSNLYKKIYNSNLVQKRIQPNQQTKNQLVQQLSKKAVKSSINYLIKNKLQKKKKNVHLKLSTDNTIYCMFFCRFGKCAKIDTCKYKHDKDKVAVCKNFLKGKCEVNGCLLSHKIDPKKMPVCQFFLKGICNTDNCPYLHVNVNVNAEICKEFVRGFCCKGDQCKLLHQYLKQCKNCKSNQCNCKKELNKKNTETNKFKRKDDKIEKTIELIELKSDDESNSNMDISDGDDNCTNKNDLCRLDFIPLVKDLKEENLDVEEEKNEETNGRTSRRSLTPTDDYPFYTNYESDDSWFEDEEQSMHSFNIQYIPKFLLN